MQVTALVHSIPVAVAYYPGPFPPNVWLVADGGEGAFIDTGFGDKESVAARLEYLRSLGVRLRHIILTHSHLDHAGGAHALRRATGAPILMHTREEPLVGRGPQDMEVPPEARAQWRRWQQAAQRATPDRLLAGGELLPVGGLSLEVIATPGHTLGSLCLYLREEGALFTGDMVLGMGTVAVAPPPYGDMGLYLDSLPKLLAYDASVLLPGHGPPVRQPALKIRELMEHRRQREEQLLAALRGGRHTVAAIVKAIYPELDRRLVPMATRQVRAHLAKLEQEGRVAVEKAGDEASYFPA